MTKEQEILNALKQFDNYKVAQKRTETPRGIVYSDYKTPYEVIQNILMHP